MSRGSEHVLLAAVMGGVDVGSRMSANERIWYMVSQKRVKMCELMKSENYGRGHRGIKVSEIIRM